MKQHLRIGSNLILFYGNLCVCLLNQPKFRPLMGCFFLLISPRYADLSCAFKNDFTLLKRKEKRKLKVYSTSRER